MAPDRSWTSSRSGRAASSRWTGFLACHHPGGRPPQTAGSVSGSKRTSRAVDFFPCCRDRPRALAGKKAPTRPDGERQKERHHLLPLRLWLGPLTLDFGWERRRRAVCVHRSSSPAGRRLLSRLREASHCIAWEMQLGFLQAHHLDRERSRGSSGSGHSVFVIVLALKHKC
jgi:hypothetical protein